MYIMNSTGKNGSRILINESQEAVNMTSQSGLVAYSTGIKVLFTCVNIPLIAFSLLALVALNRTKRTPETARFLTSVLILMDVLAAIGFAVRKFIDSLNVSIMVQVISVNFAWLAYAMIGIMSIERLIVFSWPNFYIRQLTPSRLKKGVFCILLLVSIIYYCVRIGACYITTPNFTWLDVIGSCNKATLIMFLICVFCVILSSIICYMNILRIVKMEPIPSNVGRFKGTAKSLQRYKATTIVFVYSFVVILTWIFSMILSLALDTAWLQPLLIDVFHTVNCVLDTCFYVFWFRECRMELLKMASHFYPGIKVKVERMRLEIFNVVTIEKGNFRTHNLPSCVINTNNGCSQH